MEGTDWFWDVIAATAPRVAALEAWLAAQPRTTVQRFAFAYEDASTELADYADGITVDGVTFSEDDMEDLCDWVVSQGRAYWETVVSGELPLAEAALAYHDDTTHWDTAVTDPGHRGYQSPSGIAHGVYRTRFGEDLD